MSTRARPEMLPHLLPRLLPRLLRAIAASLCALALTLPEAAAARGSAGGHKTTGGGGQPGHAGMSVKRGSEGKGHGSKQASGANRRGAGGANAGSGSSNTKPQKPTKAGSSPGKRGPRPAVGVARDDEGRIARSARQKAEFRQSHPCPSTGKTSGPCPGYVVDHQVPLKRGGADAPQNMQWQSQEAARAKDRRE